MLLTLWRLHRAAHGAGMDGIGGLFAEGRWHKQGSLVAYCGSTASIVVLERLAHLDPVDMPDDLVLSRFEAELSVVHVPPDIDIHHRIITQRFGEAFLKERAACVLRVPSVIVREEINLVVNPRHPEASAIQLRERRKFEFDPRLLE